MTSDGDRAAPVLALWATPRTVSTAFERMVMERGDLHVTTEPFSLAYYHGAEAPSARFRDRPPRPGCTYAEVLERLGFSRTHEEFYPPTGRRHPSYLLEP